MAVLVKLIRVFDLYWAGFFPIFFDFFSFFLLLLFYTANDKVYNEVYIINQIFKLFVWCLIHISYGDNVQFLISNSSFSKKIKKSWSCLERHTFFVPIDAWTVTWHWDNSAEMSVKLCCSVLSASGRADDGLLLSIYRYQEVREHHRLASLRNSPERISLPLYHVFRYWCCRRRGSGCCVLTRVSLPLQDVPMKWAIAALPSSCWEHGARLSGGDVDLTRHWCRDGRLVRRHTSELCFPQLPFAGIKEGTFYLPSTL